MKWNGYKRIITTFKLHTCGELIIAVGCIKYNKMKKKNILLPINKTVGYITTEEICKDGFELIGFFDGNNVYKKKDK